MSKRVLNHQQIQDLVDNFSDTSSISDSEYESESDPAFDGIVSDSDNGNDSDRANIDPPIQNVNVPVAGPANIDPPTQNLNVPVAGPVSIDPPTRNINVIVPAAGPSSTDDWAIIRKKPLLWKFKGRENAAVPNIENDVEYFRMLFDDEMVTNIINFSNAKGAQISRQNRPHRRRSTFGRWTNITKEEFEKFIALCILMGNVNMPSMKHYWKQKNKLYKHPLFGNTMPRNRFESILRSLRFYDIREKDISKQDKIQYIISRCVSNFQKCYSPPKQLSIDEALLGFKGRLSYKQYIPLKRSRFGIKLYELSSWNGYIIDVILYTGKGTASSSKFGHAYSVVRKLLKKYQGKGHSVYLDNYYTSIPLAEFLLKKKIQVVGTLRSNRKGIPLEIKKQKLKRGESFFMRKRHLLIQKWLDKREIYMISTRHNGDYEEVKTKFRGNVLKPKVIAEYNRHMGGIDKADQITSYYSSPRKTCRWQLKVFFHFLDLCLWNACFLRNFGKDKKNRLTYLQFRDNIITSFLKDIPIPTDPQQQVSIFHYPEKMAKRLRCRYCTIKGKRSESFYSCDTCEDKYKKKIGLCVDKCFKQYHEEKLYRML